MHHASSLPDKESNNAVLRYFSGGLLDCLFTMHFCRDVMIDGLKYCRGERVERRIIANYPEFRAVPDVRYALSTAPLSKL
jgi:hypothetical protein